MKDPWKAVAEGGMGSQHPFLKHKIIAVSRADFSDIQDVWLLLFSHSVVSDSLWPHGRQAARLPCPLPSPGAYSNSCPSSQWCQPTISSSATPFSSCPQSCPASECFSSSQVQIYELDHEEGWALKNWCFWTMVLEKTPESPLVCKEIKPVNPKGNQPWIFTGRTDAKAEAPIIWLSDVKSQLTGKALDAGKEWRWEKKGVTEDGIVR